MQDPPSERKKSYVLWLLTDGISITDINRLGWSVFKRLQDITSDTDFAWLNLTSHFCTKRIILSMSDFEILPTSAGSPTVIEKLGRLQKD